jgi:hypothetical protein
MDPKRLLVSDTDEFEGALLRSAQDDRISEAKKAALMATVLGVAAHSATAATAASTSAASTTAAGAGTKAGAAAGAKAGLGAVAQAGKLTGLWAAKSMVVGLASTAVVAGAIVATITPFSPAAKAPVEAPMAREGRSEFQGPNVSLSKPILEAPSQAPDGPRAEESEANEPAPRELFAEGARVSAGATPSTKAAPLPQDAPKATTSSPKQGLFGRASKEEEPTTATSLPVLAPPQASAPAAPLEGKAAEKPRLRLGEEAQLLERVRTRLRSGAWSEAAEALELYNEHFPAGFLRSEADVLHIEVLRATNPRAARTAAEIYLQRQPSGPHSARVRGLLESLKGPAGTSAP